MLLEERAHDLTHRLNADERASDPELLDQAAAFLADELGVAAAAAWHERPAEQRRRLLLARLDRPLRVCGMVVNRGEPGGGPFWVMRPDGEISAQIVEEAELADDQEQRETFGRSTHFNPVQIAAALRDATGRPHDLARHVDPRAVFLARKSHAGQELLALERPGLWNGGMAGWNTVFVEVPADTFAPVKTMFDLLRPEHQA